MSSQKRIASDEGRLRWHIETHRAPFSLQSPKAAMHHGSGIFKLIGFCGVLIVLECVGQEVAAVLRRSQERRHKIADDRDFERLLALDDHFARDVGISPEQKLSGPP
jgi:hypothetical protein